MTAPPAAVTAGALRWGGVALGSTTTTALTVTVTDVADGYDVEVVEMSVLVLVRSCGSTGGSTTPPDRH